MTTLAPPASVIPAQFLEAIDLPYTDAAADRRALALAEFYSHLQADPTHAALVAEAALKDFWTYLAVIAWTYDEKALTMPVKPFPPFPYCKVMADFLTEKTPEGYYEHPAITTMKSRQMLMTWMMAELSLWTSFGKSYSLTAIISKKEKAGLEPLVRARESYKNTPLWFKRAIDIPTSAADLDRYFRATDAELPNNSKIQVFTEKGGDDIRRKAPSIVLLDEACFQTSFEDTWAAVRGCTDKRCLVWVNSTLQLGYASDLFFDRTGGVIGGPGEYLHTSTGLEIWRNQLNRMFCTRLHYTADPDKRDPGWADREMAERNMDEWQWAREMEIDPEARGGLPIFPMIDPVVHIVESPVEIVTARGRPHVLVGDEEAMPCTLGLGVDHGLRNPCGAIKIAIDPDHDVIPYWDYSVSGVAASENALAIMASIEKAEGEIQYQVIDAGEKLPFRARGRRRDFDRTGDYYRYQDADRAKPLLWRLKDAQKPPGSVDRGIQAIVQMLLATLAIRTDGRHPYFERHGIGKETVDRYRKNRAIWISPLCGALVRELRAARYQDKADATVNQPEVEVDANNHVRKAMSYLLMAGLDYRG